MIIETKSNNNLESCSNCLFCDGEKIKKVIGGVKDEFFNSDPGEFDFLVCADCDSIWLSRRPIGERLIRAYSDYYTHSNEKEGSGLGITLRSWIKAAYIRSRLHSRPRLIDRIVGWAIVAAGHDTFGRSLRCAPAAPARILDYGCGNGAYLMQLMQFNYELHGVEYDPHLLGRLENLGIAIHDVATLNEDQWEGSFDHITLSHVLEHVPNPQQLLKVLSRWLKPGGSLYLELPNASATGLAIFGRFWRGLEAPRHFALPSQRALADALSRAGFVIELQHIEQAARPWLWGQSLSATPADQRDVMRRAMFEAPTENKTNAELLTLLVRKSTEVAVVAP